MRDSPIALALGDDFVKLHPAVRRHYLEPVVDSRGVMDTIHVKTLLRPLALLSYALFRAPVPRGGRDVELTLRNRTGASGTMYWLRSFSANASFPRDVIFESRMVCIGNRRVMETTRGGFGVESSVSVGDGGRLVYDIRRYVIRVPSFGPTARFPTWLSPFGGGRITETGEDDDRFAVDFQMAHPIFGTTFGYSGRCRMSG